MAEALGAAPRIISRLKRSRRRPARPARASAGEGGGDGEGGTRDHRLRNVRALLNIGEDEGACAQILSSPEGKAMAAMDLHTCARRMLGLREAIPVSDVDICAMVIEQPSLLAFEGDYKEVGPNETVVAVWHALEEKIPGVKLERLIDVCPCGFAHVLRRCMSMEGEVDPHLLEKNLLRWLQGEQEWFGIFSSRLGSEWGYMHTMGGYSTVKQVAGTSCDAFKTGSAYLAKNKQLRPQTSRVVRNHSAS